MGECDYAQLYEPDQSVISVTLGRGGSGRKGNLKLLFQGHLRVVLHATKVIFTLVIIDGFSAILLLVCAEDVFPGLPATVSGCGCRFASSICDCQCRSSCWLGMGHLIGCIGMLSVFFGD
jgi:hypothetical protein